MLVVRALSNGMAGWPFHAPTVSLSIPVQHQVLPLRIVPLDHLDLPGALEAFDGVFSSGGVSDVFEVFELDEAGEVVAGGEALGVGFGFVLGDAGLDVGGVADVECAAFVVGHDVEVAGALRTRHFSWQVHFLLNTRRHVSL